MRLDVTQASFNDHQPTIVLKFAGSEIIEYLKMYKLSD